MCSSVYETLGEVIVYGLIGVHWGDRCKLKKSSAIVDFHNLSLKCMKTNCKTPFWKILFHDHSFGYEVACLYLSIKNSS